MPRIKVALATHFPSNPEVPKGGVEAVSINLIRALSKFEDLEIHVISFNSEGGSKILKYGNVTIHQLPRSKGSTLWLAVGKNRRIVCDYLKKLDPDLVHAHDTYGIMVKGLNLRRVFTVHGFIHEDILVSGVKMARLRSIIWKKIETSAWADQPNIISISPYVRERIRLYTCARIFDVDNPIDESFFNICRKEKKNTVFCLAVMSPRKNILRLIRAVYEVNRKGWDCELRIAGYAADQRYNQQLIDEVKRLAIMDKVRFLGVVSADELIKELTTASIFALVSLEENSPLAIEQAMAAGLPILTSNKCGMPYMVKHGESGFLVDPLDVEDISRRLTQLLQDQGLRERMGAISKETAMKRFHPDYIGKRTRGVYLDILGKDSW